MVVLLNTTGFKDKNILLFISSIPLWISEWHWFAKYVIHPSEISKSLIIVITLMFWYGVGTLVEGSLSRFNKK
jgi:hypothetical protein